jgi:hypothetical protein
MRRDEADAVMSDLAARYAHGDPYHWNSASPRDYGEIRMRPYQEQVVEQHRGFSRAIIEQYRDVPTGQATVVWFNELIDSTAETFDRLGRFLGIDVRNKFVPELQQPPPVQLPEYDKKAIMGYICASS